MPVKAIKSLGSGYRKNTWGKPPVGLWQVDDTFVEKTPKPPVPTPPVVIDGFVTGQRGSYTITNVTTGLVTKTYLIPPFRLANYGNIGDELTVEFLALSKEGPAITLPSTTQIAVTAVGTTSRSGATVTLTPATWDTGSITVTRTKTIAGVTTSLVGTTFDVGGDETYYVTETASRAGYITSDPAVTATGRRPATSPFFVGGKTQNWRNTIADQTISLTNLSGGIITAPQEGDLVVISISRASGVPTPVTLVTSGYTTVFSLYANDTADTNMLIAYKRMGVTPDTDLVVTAASDLQENQSIVVQVLRDVDVATPLDASVSATGFNTAIPALPAITPTTSGATISVFGAAHCIGAPIFTVSLANAANLRNDLGSYRITVGGGTASWTSGVYTPSTWGGTANSAGSWTAASLAWKPVA